MEGWILESGTVTKSYLPSFHSSITHHFLISKYASFDLPSAKSKAGLAFLNST